MEQGMLARIAGNVGTPAYVYDASTIRRQYARLAAALARVPHHIHYSVKANSNLAVLRLLRELGAGADIVSGGEMARALAAGFPPKDIVFSGVGKGPGELRDAVAAGVGLINVESVDEIALLASIGAQAGARVPIGIRVNPDITTETHPYTQTATRGVKFGVPVDEVEAAAAACANARSLDLRSVGMHLGSQIADPEPYRKGVGALVEIVCSLRAAGIDTLRTLDVGGGFAVPLVDGGSQLDLDALAGAVAPAAKQTGLEILVEPGRYLVAEAGVLLTRVLYRKLAGGRHLAVVDAGMNDLLRPSLYGAEHDVSVLASGNDERPPVTLDVVGPVCETGDFLAHNRRLRGAAPGALLAVHGTGAYGFTMGSNYNSRPRPAEVLVDGERWAIVRQRETTTDLIRGETAEPSWQ